MMYKTLLSPALSKKIGVALSYFFLSILAVIFLVPMVWMIGTSLKLPQEVFSVPPRVFGNELQWQNYIRSWTSMPFNRFLFNSLFVGITSTFVTVFGSAMAAYAFSRIQFKGRDTLFMVYIATLMIPVQVTIVPLFIVMRDLRWIDTYQALILPVSFTAFGTFLIRQFFLTIPFDFEDSARIDGASRLTLFLRIMLPLGKSSLVTLAIFNFVTQWKNFLWPLIVVNRTSMMTIPLGLDRFQGQFGTQWHLLMAATTISILPGLIIFLFLQKQLADGIALSGLGGR